MCKSVGYYLVFLVFVFGYFVVVLYVVGSLFCFGGRVLGGGFGGRFCVSYCTSEVLRRGSSEGVDYCYFDCLTDLAPLIKEFIIQKDKGD